MTKTKEQIVIVIIIHYPLRMAETEEQIVIPPEVDADGQPLPPPKPRRPHVKGITFRDFDVRSRDREKENKFSLQKKKP